MTNDFNAILVKQVVSNYCHVALEKELALVTSRDPVLDVWVP